MRISGRCALGVCLTLAFAGCGGAGSAPPSPSGGVANVRPAYGVIYSFKGYPEDGQAPVSFVSYHDGMLYGTTEVGGSKNKGTAYALPLGSSKNDTIYSFGGSDGADPQAGVKIANNMVYGTSVAGGPYTYGTVFTISPSYNQPAAIYSFGEGGKYDGANPSGDLNYVGGSINKFYGTTQGGGTYDLGTVFEITASGYERPIYSFGASTEDGAVPLSGLFRFQSSGETFYGTTSLGGAYNRGTIYKVSLADSSDPVRVVFSFGKNSMDGQYPAAGLDGVGGVYMYGTTQNGGKYGKGTVYRFWQGTNGESYVHIMHSFKGKPSDGAYPVGGIAIVNGTLYGTTSAGGRHGGGTIFKFTSGDRYSVIHDFPDPNYPGDGTGPAAKLNYVNADGMLYGTTKSGGTGSCRGNSPGCGTVFTIAP